MSFLVLHNSDRAPLDIHAIKNIVTLGEFRQTAFIWDDGDSDAPRGAGAKPVDLDKRVWIIGRIRLDGRDALRANLHASPMESDELLCLRAYDRWGLQSLDYLQGDFCFAIWDEQRQRLLCARDQLGIKPFFYARVRDHWYLSDALESIRASGTVGDDLDDHWIADLLTTGFCLDFHRSVYKEILRLPPAHVLMVDSESETLRRYWTLDVDAPLFYRHERQYLERFHELLAASIRDRIPEGKVGVSMSGGLDSSTLAAKTVRLAGASRVIANTRHFEHLIPDEEKHYSSLVARRLGIELTLTAVDDVYYDRDWETRNVRTPEPTARILGAASERVFGVEMAKQAPVWFFGEGPDNALTFEWRSYLTWLRRQRDYRRLGVAVIQYLSSKQWSDWLITIKKLRPNPNAIQRKTTPPLWMDEALVKRADVVARLGVLNDGAAGMHPWRPRAMQSFTSAIWPHLFEEFDSTVTGVPIEWRHPYTDLRLLKFFLSVPPIPWARRKLLMREAMKGELPEPILKRPKTPLAGDPVVKMIEKHPLPAIALCKPIREFVNEAELPTVPGHPDDIDGLIKLRILNFWLKNR